MFGNRLKELLVKITAKSVGWRGARRDAKNLTDTLSGLRRTAIGIAGAGGLTLLATGLFNVGAAAAETESKFNTVFGDVAAQVDQAGSAVGRLAGLSQTATRDILATTGSIAQGLGATKEQSAELSRTVLRLAGDFGSFNNLPTAEVAQAITASFTGEREQLKRLGVAFREVDVEQRALSQTGRRHARELSQLEKVQASLNLIAERGSTAMGDLARTQDSAANRAKRLQAAVADIRDTVSRGLLPVLEQSLPLLEDFAAKAERFAQKIPGILAKIRDRLSPDRNVGTSRLRAQEILQGLNLKDIDSVSSALGRIGDQAAGARRNVAQYQSILAGLTEAHRRGGQEGGALNAALQQQQDRADTLQFVMEGLRERIISMSAAARTAGSGLGDLGAGAGAAGRNTKTVADILKEMEERLVQSASLGQVLGSSYHVQAEQTKIYTKAIEDLIEKGLGPMDERVLQLQGRLHSLNEGTLEAVANFAQFSLAQRHSGEETTRTGKKIAEGLTATEATVVRIATQFSEVLPQALDRGLDALKDFVKAAARELLSLAAKFAVFKFLDFIAPGSAITRAFGTSAGFLTARAGGGSAFAGKPLLLGERGPEFFVPHTDGRIVPSAVSTGGGAGGDMIVQFITAAGDLVDQITVRQNRDSRLQRVTVPGLVALGAR